MLPPVPWTVVGERCVFKGASVCAFAASSRDLVSRACGRSDAGGSNLVERRGGSRPSERKRSNPASSRPPSARRTATSCERRNLTSLKLISTNHPGPVGVAPTSKSAYQLPSAERLYENHCAPIGRRVAFDMDAGVARRACSQSRDRIACSSCSGLGGCGRSPPCRGGPRRSR